MRSICLRRPNRRVAALIVCCVGVLLLAAPAEASTVCDIAEPVVEAGAQEIVFTVIVDCEAKAVSSEQSVLVGMSLYATGSRAETAVEAHINKSDESISTFSDDVADWQIQQKPRARRKDRRVLVQDEQYDTQGGAPLDLAVQEVTLGPAPAKTKLTFRITAAQAVGRDGFIIAVWPTSQKNSCDKADQFARDGCTKFGFVIGDFGGIYPFDAYPGMATETNEKVDGKPIWIAEKFR